MQSDDFFCFLYNIFIAFRQNPNFETFSIRVTVTHSVFLDQTLKHLNFYKNIDPGYHRFLLKVRETMCQSRTMLLEGFKWLPKN